VGRSEATVPKKNKTNKSLKKRLRVTGSGKIKHTAPGKRHLNAHMTAKRKRQLRRAGLLPAGVVKKYLIALGEY
jgi:large subunit ribosomal protein L35